LVSDAGQVEVWPKIKPFLKEGDALYFSHGFAITYRDQTGVNPPENVDVILVAPKGSGRSVRANFIEGSGINSSYAVFQDYTGKAKERTLAVGVAIGSGYLFPTNFEKEVYSDLVGERGVLMGCLAGVMEAQYNILRKHGHSPSEAFNETVEELTRGEKAQRKMIERVIGRLNMTWGIETPRHLGADYARFHLQVGVLCDQLQVVFNRQLGNEAHPHALNAIRG